MHKKIKHVTGIFKLGPSLNINQIINLYAFYISSVVFHESCIFFKVLLPYKKVILELPIVSDISVVPKSKSFQEIKMKCSLQQHTFITDFMVQNLEWGDKILQT